MLEFGRNLEFSKSSRSTLHGWMHILNVLIYDMHRALHTCSGTPLQFFVPFNWHFKGYRICFNWKQYFEYSLKSMRIYFPNRLTYPSKFLIWSTEMQPRRTEMISISSFFDGNIPIVTPVIAPFRGHHCCLWHNSSAGRLAEVACAPGNILEICIWGSSGLLNLQYRIGELIYPTLICYSNTR